ncbi:MAG: flagellin, partial [Verrucomicrobia bacterium]|nr:flagellin [Verrucomicrobiota bacterium]
KSLSRLSSGSKIIAPSDDAAGLAVSSRLESQLKRLDAAINNVVNAVSFTQTQDGFLKTIDKAFRRMSELAMFAQDSTKSASDLTLYSQEFTQLQDYVSQSVKQTFNSVKLFSATPLAVTIDSSGTTFDMAPIDLGKSEYTSSLNIAQSLGSATGIANTDVSNIARLAGGTIQMTVSATEYAKLKKDGSLTISGLTTATLQGGSTATDISSLNGTFDIKNAFKVAGVSDTYIVELDGSAAGKTALGVPTTWTSVPAGATSSTFVDGATLSAAVAPIISGSLTAGALTGALATGLVAKTGLDITSVPRAQASLTRIRNSIDKLAQDRASLGAVQSRLNFTNEQLTVTKENLSAAISRIADVDVAEEATSYARYQILVQSGTSMLAQANKMPQSALQLLQG